MSDLAGQHRVQLVQLRARTSLPLEGDVSQRGAPEGIYGDSWASPQLRFSIQAGRDVTAFVVVGMIPEWWPSETPISIGVNGAILAQETFRPGQFELSCSAPLRAGDFATVTIRTGVTAYDGEQERQLGAYIGVIRAFSVGRMRFQCNICETQNGDLDPMADPEGSLCTGCGANLRLRALAYLIGDALFGKSLTLSQFGRPNAVGLGVSDSPGFDRHLKRAIPNYVNTQYDDALVGRRSPFLDIANPEPRFVGTADFVTCSEVLEHVPPPVQRSFDGLYSLLRPGGTLILTVPYTLGETIEHFPDLDTWRLEHYNGERILVNRTASGEVQRFNKLRFHGGGEDVLEMRVFGLEDIFAGLEAAGFIDIRVRDENVLDYGIFFKYNWGLPITAKRPSGS